MARDEEVNACCMLAPLTAYLVNVRERKGARVMVRKRGKSAISRIYLILE